MNSSRLKKHIIICLLILELITVFLTCKSFSNKNIDEIREVYEVEKKLFAMYTENEDGTYSEYTSSNYFPGVGYVLNLDKSSCVDNKGNEIENILIDSANKVTVNSNKSAYCYLYFKKIDNLYELCKDYADLNNCITNEENMLKGIDNLSEEEQGGMYRYQGTHEVVNNNYICFGTSNVEECINNTDKYMYRIIGITSDGKLKIIKKEALSTSLQWYSDRATDISWADSLIFSNINGSTFLTNSDYIPESWRDKIMYVDWKYGDNKSINVSALELYAIENAWENIVNAKIGLMYAYDYYYAYQSGGLNCSESGEYTKCLNSWLHLSNNDTSVIGDAKVEWTMSRYGKSSSGTYYHSWRIYSEGDIHNNLINSTLTARPVFYLKSDIKISGGEGILNNPYIM